MRGGSNGGAARLSNRPYRANSGNEQNRRSRTFCRLLTQQIENARLKFCRIIVPVSVNLPLDAGAWTAVGDAPSLDLGVRLDQALMGSAMQHHSDTTWRRAPADDFAHAREAAHDLYADIDRHLAVGVISGLLAVDEVGMARVAKLVVLAQDAADLVVRTRVGRADL